MAKYIYPAIFEKEGTMYTVCFPDLEGCYTQGEDWQDAYDMASDVLCLTLYNLEEDGQPIPPASPVGAIAPGENGFVSLVSCDTLEYRQFYDDRGVKKAVTIPSWLNTMSERAGVNFSTVLQAALKDKLHISDR